MALSQAETLKLGYRSEPGEVERFVTLHGAAFPVQSQDYINKIADPVQRAKRQKLRNGLLSNSQKEEQIDLEVHRERMLSPSGSKLIKNESGTWTVLKPTSPTGPLSVLAAAPKTVTGALAATEKPAQGSPLIIVVAIAAALFMLLKKR